jgi:hypothetical protein
MSAVRDRQRPDTSYPIRGALPFKHLHKDNNVSVTIKACFMASVTLAMASCDLPQSVDQHEVAVAQKMAFQGITNREDVDKKLDVAILKKPPLYTPGDADHSGNIAVISKMNQKDGQTTRANQLIDFVCYGCTGYEELKYVTSDLCSKESYRYAESGRLVGKELNSSPRYYDLQKCPVTYPIVGCSYYDTFDMYTIKVTVRPNYSYIFGLEKNHYPAPHLMNLAINGKCYAADGKRYGDDRLDCSKMPISNIPPKS